MTAARQRLDLVRHLEFFVAVADELHFGRAADLVGVSQPPLSQGVRRLEHRLGSALFDRTTRGVALTAAGTALLPHARRILADVALLIDAADDARSAPVGLRLGVPPQLPVQIVAALLAGIRHAVPDRRVEIRTAPSAVLLQSAVGGEVDAAVVVHPSPVARLLAGPLVRLPGRVLVASDHALARTESGTVTLAELARALPIALPPRAHHPAAHDQLLDVFARHGIAVSTRQADDDRAATLAAASGSDAALTADAALASPSVANLAILGDPLPLRLRIVRPVGETDIDRTRAVAAVQDGLASFGVAR